MNLYSEILLDNYFNPQNYGDIKDPDASGEEYNPQCGDKIKVFLKFGKNNEIEDVKFSAEGCAVSVGAMSLLSEKIIGMEMNDILSLDFESLQKLIEMPLSEGRIKCSTLGLNCVKKLIGTYNEKGKNRKNHSR